ncbi:MAG: hypothetical protein ACRC1P_02965 [Cellulosilyticaceae bacterium]
MQEVIREIIKIDQLAFENQKHNEEELEKRKQSYMNGMKEYKEHKLSKADKKAEEMYAQIIGEGEQSLKIEEEKSKQLTLLIQNKYLQVEEGLVDRIFKELFVVEA